MSLDTAVRPAPGTSTWVDRLAWARLVALRLGDEALLQAGLAQTLETAAYPNGWSDASLLSGRVGVALACQQLSLADPDDAPRWTALAQGHLATAVRSTGTAPLTDHGLAAGTAGLALGLLRFAASEPRYGPALDAVATQLALGVLEDLPPVPQDGCGFGDYDLVSGPAGTLVALAHLSAAVPSEPVLQARSALVRVLLELLGDGSPAGVRCWVRPDRYPVPEYALEHPDGQLNLGLAHGLPGVLLALAAAAEAGARDPGLREGIRSASALLADASLSDEHGPDWPAGLPVPPSADGAAAPRAARTAWCYGAPGVAAALARAGSVLADPALSRTAVDALLAAAARLARAGDFSSPTLCHGAAGLLAVTDAVADRTGDARLRALLPWLADRVLVHCDAGLPLGVQDTEGGSGARLDDPSLLTGASGVVLALTTGGPAATRGWHEGLGLA